MIHTELGVKYTDAIPVNDLDFLQASTKYNGLSIMFGDFVSDVEIILIDNFKKDKIIAFATELIALVNSE